MEPVPLLRCFDLGTPPLSAPKRGKWVAIGVAICSAAPHGVDADARVENSINEPRRPLTQHSS